MLFHISKDQSTLSECQDKLNHNVPATTESAGHITPEIVCARRSWSAKLPGSLRTQLKTCLLHRMKSNPP